MKRDAGWEDLQLQAKLRAYLKDDFIGFRKAIYRLEQNLSYFKEKLSIKDNFLVRNYSRGAVYASSLTAFVGIGRVGARLGPRNPDS